ncbi:hypothetical protein AVEN_32039-1 [Araneus ventricosus]|uniref:Uncharacterized protein n=1 Tax=Araneus ventricosus TaxID=182803 RepID=A0A4Y2JT31_ARAVE|nr:hypothetical protein AVEN_32039-1 [Araneus ventricosus]
MEDKTGSAFCVMEEDITKYEWMAQLSPFNTVFQTELLAIQEACLWASKTNKQVKDNGETGRSVHNVLPKVKTTPTPRQRPEIMFVTGYGPFAVHLKRLNIRNSDSCGCETWEPPYTMLQAACLQPHTT